MIEKWKPTLSIFSSELFLGALVALCSIVVALSGYQSAMADSDQTKNNVQAQQLLTDANADYLSANQLTLYDYDQFDRWYTSADSEKKAFYESNFSEQLQQAHKANPEDPFGTAYYTAMYAETEQQFTEANRLFELAEAFNQRGDALQLVLLVAALGLSIAAWGALLGEDSWLRSAFGLFSFVTLIYALFLYLRVPLVTG